MVAKVHSSTVVGIQAVPVLVEVDIARGLPQFHIVGLPDSTVRESKQRVRSAISNAGFPFPLGRITVNLAPGTIRKVGSAYDLPIAIGILAAQGVVSQTNLSKWIIMGELALDGQIRGVYGALCAALDLVNHARRGTKFMIPKANVHEITPLPHVRAFAVQSLQHAIHVIRNTRNKKEQTYTSALIPPIPTNSPIVLDPIVGQDGAKRALEIAVAGGHHALIVGSPGSGKTLLGERLQHMLPPLTKDQLIDVNRIYSAAGLLDSASALRYKPPIRAPHHTATLRQIIGGGQPIVPGEISLAHHGIMLLDEIALFSKAVLDGLLEPLQTGRVRVVHRGNAMHLPASASLIGITNPCPCGWLGDDDRPCHCSPAAITRYRRKLMTPLLDRIDIIFEVRRVPVWHGKKASQDARPLSAVQNRIAQARTVQRQRNKNMALNARLQQSFAEDIQLLDIKTKALLERAAEKYALSTRRIQGLIRVAQTIADLHGESTIRYEHMAESIAYRLPFELSSMSGSMTP